MPEKKNDSRGDFYWAKQEENDTPDNTEMGL